MPISLNQDGKVVAQVDVGDYGPCTLCGGYWPSSMYGIFPLEDGVQRDTPQGVVCPCCIQQGDPAVEDFSALTEAHEIAKAAEGRDR